MSDSLQPHGLYSPWNSPGQNSGVGSLSLLQGIFPTQGSNPGFPHCRQILYHLSHQPLYPTYQLHQVVVNIDLSTQRNFKIIGYHKQTMLLMLQLLLDQLPSGKEF